MSETAKHLLPAFLSVMAGGIVQGVLGFGCSLVWMSFFPLFTTVADAVGVLQPLAIGVNSLLLTQLWDSACLSDLKPLAAVAPIGILFGLWVVTTWSSSSVNFLLGTFLILYVGNAYRENYYNRKEEEEEGYSDENDLEMIEPMIMPLEGETTNNNNNTTTTINKITLDPLTTTPARVTRKTDEYKMRIAFPAGFIGGCLTSAFGTGGPAILVFARESGWQDDDPRKFRANLQVVFFSMNVLAISSQVYSGIINGTTFPSSIKLLPAMVIGVTIGHSISPWIKKEVFRSLTLAGLGTSLFFILTLDKLFFFLCKIESHCTACLMIGIMGVRFVFISVVSPTER